MKKKTTEEITREFFKRRFPNKDIEFEKKCGYFQTWEKRFESGSPENFMDLISIQSWSSMQDWIKGEEVNKKMGEQVEAENEDNRK